MGGLMTGRGFRQSRTSVLSRGLWLALALLGLPSRASGGDSPKTARFPKTTTRRSDRIVRSDGTVRIGSKAFPESQVLSEMLAQLIEAHTELPVERKFGLGGTLICYEALKSGEIDLYPEYTGTAWAAILNRHDRITDPLRVFLEVSSVMKARDRVIWLSPFGFNNSYALAMREDRAKALGIESLSDLAKQASSLKAGLSVEFLRRNDGYLGLEKAYGFRFQELRGMEHSLVYEAIQSGAIDLTDVYTTDGMLTRFEMRVLKDDSAFFPPYDGAPIVREALLLAHPELQSLLDRLAFQIDDAAMQRLNDEVSSQGLSFETVARRFLKEKGLLNPQKASLRSNQVEKRGDFWTLMQSRAGTTLGLTLQHIWLTAVSVSLAALFAIPLGLLIARFRWLSGPALGIAGVLQTIPSLALLALMISIPGLGLGSSSAILALFLYAILPILRNTYTGILNVDPSLLEAGRGIGLSDLELLWHVELPLAASTIMAGVRTASVIGVGVTTLAAFIGAGGLGQPILTGLYLNDSALILTGAVPAAILALFVDRSLGFAERRFFALDR